MNNISLLKLSNNRWNFTIVYDSLGKFSLIIVLNSFNNSDSQSVITKFYNNKTRKCNLKFILPELCFIFAVVQSGVQLPVAEPESDWCGLNVLTVLPPHTIGLIDIITFPTTSTS